MLGAHHAICGAATGLVACRLVAVAPAQVVPAIALCAVAALLPDIDEPRSVISRRMPYVVGLFAGAWWMTVVWGTLRLPTLAEALDDNIRSLLYALLVSLVVGALAPVLIKAVFGHRGLVHHPLLGLVMLILGSAASLHFQTIAPAIAALGWCVHLVGDAMTHSGLPWRRGRRWWVLPRAYRFRVGSVEELTTLVIWIVLALVVVGPAYLQSVVVQPA